MRRAMRKREDKCSARPSAQLPNNGDQACLLTTHSLTRSVQLRFTCLTAVSLSAASSHSIMSPNTAKVVRGCGVIAVSSLSLTACTTLLRRLREDKLKNCQWHRPVCQCYCCCCSWLPLSSFSAGHRVAVSSSACTLSVVPHSSAGLSLSRFLQTMPFSTLYTPSRISSMRPDQ